MKLSPCHLEYWRQVKQPVPTWGAKLAEQRRRPSIDELVNAHAGIRINDYELQAHNTLGILRSARKRGALLHQLQQMALRTETAIDPHIRLRYCRRWLKRMNERKANVRA